MNNRTGFFTDISFEEYCEIDAVNNSSLNDFDRSPAHYWAKHRAPDRVKEAPTPSMYFGTAIHTAVLEFNRFIETYAVRPMPENFPQALDKADQYKAKAKELGLKVSGTKPEMKKAILEADPNVEFFEDIESYFAKSFKLIEAHQLTACLAISQRIKGSPTAATLFNGGQSEVTMLWEDLGTGLPCKARIDYLTEMDGKKIIIDLKSTEDARPREFARSIANYNYHRQAAHYLNGVIALGHDPGLFVFAAYERQEPYAASFTYASEAMLTQARAELGDLMLRLHNARRDERWPAYDETLMPINLPKWRMGALGANNNQKELETF